ncbi:hypothetical protein J2Z44_001679 [Clostridium punense]|uniref:Uncharacterized protein n=1 Tax=Clostridium punense TaxID=1054297 RepID=A0ABS4K281_9CLOT|nr:MULTISPECIES: hypothetical protein [Clostridium]EQB90139.1 hypothetical protein M918_01265 [Clostridium sp. BL8]MBP2021883.1 hypothetical protein [Clostridium punense]
MSIDEKIAQLEMAKKVLEKEKREAALKKEDLTDGEHQLEEQRQIKEAIENGYLEMYGKKLKFSRRKLLGENIEMPVIEDYFKLIADTEENFIQSQEEEGVSVMINALPSDGPMNSKDFKKGMEDNFKTMGLYVEWVREDEVKLKNNSIKYFTFTTPTALGTVYNMIFFYKKKNKIIVGNFNFPNKDISIWEKIFTGMIELISI